MNEEILELIDRYHDGDLSESEIDQLRESLKNDPELRKEFVRERLLDAAFELEAAGNPGAIPPAASMVEFPTPRRRTNWSQIATIAAAVVLSLSAGFALKSWFVADAGLAVIDDEDIGDDGVALVTRAIEAKWADGARPGAGGILSPGLIELTSGLVQIEFYSGARVALEGPATLELISATEAICKSGKLRAFVPPHARGFTVKSHQFELVDLGTEFGINVNAEGESKIQVFDGEVEVYPADAKRSPAQLKRILGGSGMAWAASGKSEDISTGPEHFPSFEDVKIRTEHISKQRFSNWQSWHEKTLNDPRIAAYYDFEDQGSSQLTDHSAKQANGSIVGSEWSNGRWPGKGALEFKRPGDRVRLDIPGEFDNLTMAAWIRMDAQTGRAQSLLLTDRYEVGRVHWQFSRTGSLRLGIRLPEDKSKTQISGSGYGTKNLFQARRIGTWNLVTTVYDREAGHVSHFLNGRKITRQPIVFDQPLQIGAANIGNWGIPLGDQKPRQAIRNFVGKIDEMAIWNAALTPDEIREMHQQTRP